MYLCIMKNNAKIIQYQFRLDNEDYNGFHYQLILLFVSSNNKIIGSTIVNLPNWQRFFDSEFRYYPMCFN